MKAKVKSCPFCGSFDLSLTRSYDYIRIVCDNCFARGPFGNSKIPDETVAIRLWNKRTSRHPEQEVEWT